MIMMSQVLCKRVDANVIDLHSVVFSSRIPSRQPLIFSFPERPGNDCNLFITTKSRFKYVSISLLHLYSRTGRPRLVKWPKKLRNLFTVFKERNKEVWCYLLIDTAVSEESASNSHVQNEMKLKTHENKFNLIFVN